MAENLELEELDQLVRSPGWARFRAMVDAQWGPSSEWFLGELDKVLGSDDARSTEHFRQIRAAQREIQKVLQLVPHRLELLTRPTPSSDTSAGSRRGLL